MQQFSVLVTFLNSTHNSKLVEFRSSLYYHLIGSSPLPIKHDQI